MPSKEIVEAVKKALEGAKERKFMESVELSINLKDIDLSIPKNRIDEDILLPKGRGKKVKVAVFGSGDLALKAKAVADRVITPEELDTIASNKRNAKKLGNEYNFFVAEAPMMVNIGKKLGIALGPRGKMPKPIPPQADPAPIVNALRNTVKARSKDKKTFHVPIGTKEMKPEDIAENIEAVVKRLESKLERGRANIASIYVKTTMGPAIKVL